MRISDWSSDVCSSDLFGRFIPKTVISKLKYSLPWYERDPFSRSKYFRFYRLHPRFSSIFFPNFLPRFVEPSLKAFEFLIRPILLKPFDLRLPFTLRKGVRLSLLMSLVSSEGRRVGKGCCSKCRCGWW